MIVAYKAVHLGIRNANIVSVVRYSFAGKKDSPQNFAQPLIIVYLSHQGIKEQIACGYNAPDDLADPLLVPPKCRVLIQQLANPADQEGVAGGVVSNGLGDGVHIHPSVVISLILPQHTANVSSIEAHVHIKVRSDVPGAVELMGFIWTQLTLEVLHIRDAGEDDGLESRNAACFPSQVSVSQLCQKIQKNLIVRCAVHLIDDQNDRSFRSFTPFAKHAKYIIQLNAVGFSIIQSSHFRNILIRHISAKHIPCIDYDPAQRLYEVSLGFKSTCTDALKVQAENGIFRIQVRLQRRQRGRLAVLPGAVDREIVSRIYHRFDGFQTGRQVHHIVF